MGIGTSQITIMLTKTGIVIYLIEQWHFTLLTLILMIVAIKWSKWGLYDCSLGQDVSIYVWNFMIGVGKSGEKVD